MQRLNPTKLDELLADKTGWDDQTWFRTERYLVNNLSRPGMLAFVTLAGGEPTGADWYSKTDAVKLLRNLSPRDILNAWDRWRAR